MQPEVGRTVTGEHQASKVGPGLAKKSQSSGAPWRATPSNAMLLYLESSAAAPGRPSTCALRAAYVAGECVEVCASSIILRIGSKWTWRPP